MKCFFSYFQAAAKCFLNSGQLNKLKIELTWGVETSLIHQAWQGKEKARGDVRTPFMQANTEEGSIDEREHAATAACGVVYTGSTPSPAP